MTVCFDKCMIAVLNNLLRNQILEEILEDINLTWKWAKNSMF
jgi:hypothetical protein